MVDRALFSSNKEDWETPQWLFNELNREFDFNLDAAGDKHNAKCENYIIEEVDSLSEPWLLFSVNVWGGTKSRVWLNPPYGRSVGKWVEKAVEEVKAGHSELVVMLLPARPDTKYFHRFIWDKEKHQPRPGVEVRFLEGRLKFGGATNSAPFPSMVVIFRPQYPHNGIMEGYV